jgi:type I restriction enzyme M protein
MNMAVHGLDGDIVQGNTFYDDKHELVGKCDYVMANPPFNVDGVDKSKDSVKNDARLPFGLPNNDNANYLWIQYFYSYLNETGRAGFVMASSGSDAGHSEKLIRKEIIDTGAVDVMVSIGNKFFYSVTLPCALWFFDRAKEKDEVRKDQVLMLDLRNVYRKVSSSLHDFTQAHLNNIHAIVGLYRGDNTLYNKLVESYETTENTTELEWLTSRFPDGIYVDIEGLCKIANRAEIADNDYSLTPGRYVGVEDQIDPDFDYETEMGMIKMNLKELNEEANTLAAQIQTNLEELGL